MEEGNTYQPLKMDSKRNNGIYQPVIKETMVSLETYLTYSVGVSRIESPFTKPPSNC